VFPNWSHLLEDKEEVILMALAQRKIKEEKPIFQEAMEVWQKLATPGAPHKVLARMAGTWKAKMKSWMEPLTLARCCSKGFILIDVVASSIP